MTSKFQTAALVLPSGSFFEELKVKLVGLLSDLGMESQTIPSEFSSGSRLGQACAAIEKADLMLADITGRNPNTMYLAGYAHGIGKRVLFLAWHGEDLAFDPARHEVLIYHGQLEFLAKNLAEFLVSGAAPDQESAPPAASLDAHAKFIEVFGDIMKEHGAEHPGKIRMEGEGTFVLVDQDLDLPVVQALARRARELKLRIKLL